MARSPSCPACGTPVSRAGARFCDACGRALETSEPCGQTPPEAGPPLEERFRALREDPRFPAWVRAVPEAGPSLADALRASFLALFVLVLAVLCTLPLMLFLPPLAPVPIVVAVVAVLWLLATGWRALARSRGTLAHLPALVLSTRRRLAATEGTEARAEHRTELLLESGERRELPTEAEVAEELREGRLGVAVLRAGRIVGFLGP